MHRALIKARENMVWGQILPNHVTDPRLIAALRQVPRESFLPRAQQALAYADADVPVGNGQTLPAPLTLARMIQAADVQETDIVLDIGGGGYSAALLARLANTVILTENDAARARQAEKTLLALSVINAPVVVTPDPLAGYAAQAPYNVILLGGAVREIPSILCEQLAPGGRGVAVVAGETPHAGYITVMTRTRTGFKPRRMFSAALPPLPGPQAAPAFLF